MSILNLAMYGVALVRQTMSDEVETLSKAAGGSMAKMRHAVIGNGDLKEACMASVLPVRNLLEQRYSQLELKGNAFKTLQPVSEDEMLQMLSYCALIDSVIPQSPSGLHLKSKDLKRLTGLREWVELHVDHSEYSIGISKQCWDCVRDGSDDDGAAKYVYKQSVECPACSAPTIYPDVFMSLEKRKPLLPFPEPSASREEQHEWAKCEEQHIRRIPAISQCSQEEAGS